MKKNLRFFHPPFLPAMVRIRTMMTILFVTLSVFNLQARDGAVRKVTITVNDAKLIEVLSTIEKQTGLNFFYSDDQIDTQRKVSVHLDDVALYDALHELFKNTSVHYKLVENYVVLTVRNKSSRGTPSLPETRINPDRLTPWPDVEYNTKKMITTYATAVSGKITDESDMPMPGVNVVEKGTTNGVVTNADGEYKLNVGGPNSVLIFSFTGYAHEEVTVGNQTVINLKLTPDVQSLSEVVVIGYGTTKKSDLTGAVTKVEAKDFNQGVIVSPEQLVQGKVAGLQIVNTSGAPAGETTVRIRGTSSVRSGNQPLIVVDGIPLDGRSTQPSASVGGLGQTPDSNPLSFINSNDIESIDVLKDASATAIYGSRGANGVIIITTKKGKSGAPKVDFSISTGFSNKLRSADNMTAGEYRQTLQQRNLTSFDGGTSIDPIDQITRTAVSQNYNAALSGGDLKGNYRVSFGYTDQQGIVKKSDFKKYVGNISGRYSFLKDDRLHVDLNLIASNTINQGTPMSNNANLYGSLIGNALEWNPTVPLKNPDGTFVQQNYTSGAINIAGVGTNPLALIEYYNDQSDVTNILGNVSPSFRIINGLEYKLTIGFNQAKASRVTDLSGDLFLNSVTDLGSTNVGYSALSTRTITNTLTYTKDLSEKINLNALIGQEFITYKRYGYNIAAKGFSNFDVAGSDILQNPLNSNIAVTSYRDPRNELQSFFTRLNFNIAKKFLITATFRADGSTKFGSNNKYGYFPSVAGAWIISEERFVPEVLSTLKLRAGWGRTGNQEFPSGAAQSRYSFGQQTMFLTNVANPNLKWETTESVNFGLDFGILEDRITGYVDYFDKRTKDLLFLLPTVQPAPAASYWTNLPATVINRGVEVVVNSVVVQREDFRVNFGVNATFLKNTFTDYSGAPILTGNINGNGLASGIPSQQLSNNQPLFVFNMVEFLGLNENGVAQYSDQKKYVGNPNPTTLLGINAGFEKGKFSFSLSFNGAFGHKVYNNTRMVNLATTNLNIGRNSTPEIGLSNENLGNANVISTRYLESGNFLRLNNANLTYAVGDRGGFRNIRVFLTGQNLLLFTSYKGFDPEVNTNKGVNGVPSFGIDYGAYPTARTFLVGVNFSL